jgi:hypothetical protein
MPKNVLCRYRPPDLKMVQDYSARVSLPYYGRLVMIASARFGKMLPTITRGKKHLKAMEERGCPHSKKPQSAGERRAA